MSTFFREKERAAYLQNIEMMILVLCVSVLLLSSTVADAKSVRLFKKSQRSGKEAVRQILKDFVSDIQSDEYTSNPIGDWFLWSDTSNPGLWSDTSNPGLWSDTTNRNIILALKQLRDAHQNPFHFTAPMKKKDLEMKINPFHFRLPARDDKVRFSYQSQRGSSVKNFQHLDMVE